jgi:glutaredoxin-related protein
MLFYAIVMEQNARKVLEEQISRSKMKTSFATLPQIYTEAEDIGPPHRDVIMLMYIFRERHHHHPDRDVYPRLSHPL